VTTPSTVTADPLAALEEIRQRTEAATPGPWTPHVLNAGRDRGFAEVDFPYHPRAIQVRQPPRRYAGGECVVNQQDAKADAEFIAAARNAFPRLLAGYDALLKLHQPGIYVIYGDLCKRHENHRFFSITDAEAADVRACGDCEASATVFRACKGCGRRVDAERCPVRSLIAAALEGTPES
jgi:hypothetical protein